MEAGKIIHRVEITGPMVDELAVMFADAELAEALNIARKARVTVHVRGTDAKPVVECLDKGTRRVVGGSELKRRLAG